MNRDNSDGTYLVQENSVQTGSHMANAPSEQNDTTQDKSATDFALKKSQISSPITFTISNQGLVQLCEGVSTQAESDGIRVTLPQKTDTECSTLITIKDTNQGGHENKAQESHCLTNKGNQDIPANSATDVSLVEVLSVETDKHNNELIKYKDKQSKHIISRPRRQEDIIKKPIGKVSCPT